MKRNTVLALLSAAALFTAGCGGSDAESGSGTSGSSTGDSLPAVVTEPPTTDPAVDSPSDELAGDTVVFVWTEMGGCAMAGPNCARYAVTVDGTVTTSRVDAADDAESTGEVDPALVQDWRDAVAETDFEALRARVGEGELTAAFDGIDYFVDNPSAGVELSSVATNFDRSEPVFAAAFALAEAAAAAAPLELQMR